MSLLKRFWQWLIHYPLITPKPPPPAIVPGAVWVRRNHPPWSDRRVLIDKYAPGWVGYRFWHECLDPPCWGGPQDYSEDLFRELYKPSDKKP